MQTLRIFLQKKNIKKRVKLVQRKCFALAQNLINLLGPWTHSPLDPWGPGPLDTWTLGPLDPWYAILTLRIFLQKNIKKRVKLV